MEHGPVALYEDKEYDYWQYVGDVYSCPLGEFEAFSGVGFFLEVFPSPSDFACAEEEVDQASDWEEVVAYEEVFQIQDVFALSQW